MKDQKKNVLDEEQFNKLYKKYSTKDPNKIKSSQAKALLLKEIAKKYKLDLEESVLDGLIKTITNSEQIPEELNKEQFQVLFFKSTWGKLDLSEEVNMIKLNLLEKAEARSIFVTEKSIFGVDVSIAAERSDLEYGIIPSVIRDGIDLLNKKGLREEGLWRIPGNFTVYMKYREQYDNGLIVDLTPILEPTNVTSILVNYFKHTTESIFTNKLKPMFEHLLENEKCFTINSVIASNDPEPYQQLRFAILKLPVTNREILRLMAAHLKRLLDNKAENLMNIDAIAICFGILMGATISKLLTFVISHYDYFDYLIPQTPVFGYSLEVGLKIAQSVYFNKKFEIPVPIEVCINWLNKKKRDSSLWVESGDFIKVKKLCKRFDSGEDFEIEDDEDPDIVSACVKHYFAKCPDLLFGGKDYYTEGYEMINQLQEEEKKVEALRNILVNLPEVNQKVIRKVSSHLYKHFKDHPDEKGVKPHIICPLIYRALIHPVLYFDKLYTD